MSELINGFAEVIERLTTRFNSQAALHRVRYDAYDKLIASMKADHEAKLAEHLAAFGARTEADAKIIAGLRSEIGVSRMAVLERDSLMSERDALRAEVARLKSQSPKQHPVKAGEWLRKTTDGLMYKAGECLRLTGYEIIHGEIWCNLEDGASWLMSVCEPCDPPATHDTEAGKAAAESAVKTEPAVTEEIKVGDLGEVFQATTRTLNSDVGITGCVSSIHLDPCHGGFLVKFDPSTQSRRSAGMQAFGLCDVRKVTT